MCFSSSIDYRRIGTGLTDATDARIVAYDEQQQRSVASPKTS